MRAFNSICTYYVAPSDTITPVSRRWYDRTVTDLSLNSCGDRSNF